MQVMKLITCISVLLTPCINEPNISSNAQCIVKLLIDWIGQYFEDN